MNFPFSVEFAAGPFSWIMALVCAGVFFWHAKRSAAGKALLALRGLAVLWLILALLQPAINRRSSELEKSKLLILLDNSHAMQAKSGSTSRLEKAALWLKKQRRSIKGAAQPSIALVSDRAQLLSWENLSDVTASQTSFEPDIALSQAQRNLNPGALPQRIWLISDGVAEPSSNLQESLAAFKAPVDVIGVASPRNGKGLDLVDIKPPDFAFLHERFNIGISIEATDLAGAELRLRLLRQSQEGDSNPQWDLADETNQKIGSAFEAITSSFSVTAQSLGTEKFKIEALAGPGAAAISRQFHVEVIRQKYRIMYLAGRPSSDYVFLRDFLKSDPNRELVSFVILRNPENPVTVPDNELSLIPFPADEIFVRDISQFDLFILENFAPSRFHFPPTYLESLRNFVAKGGALLLIGGENAFNIGGYAGTPLEDLLPVTLQSSQPDFIEGLFNARPTSLAHPMIRLYDTEQASQAAWKALPQLDGYARIDSIRPQTSVLAVHPSEHSANGEPLPIISLRRYGKGKVLMLSTDSTWRWRLGTGNNWRITDFYQRFWSRAVEYLTGSLDLSKVKFAPLPEHLPPHEPAEFSLRVFDSQFRPAPNEQVLLSVLWTSPDGHTRSVEARPAGPGTFTMDLTGLAAGAHRLRAVAKFQGKPWGEDQISFLWEPSRLERPMDRDWLKNAAQLGGGNFFELDSLNISDILNQLPKPRHKAELSQRYHPSQSPWYLALAIACFLLEWALRRFKGYA